MVNMVNIVYKFQIMNVRNMYMYNAKKIIKYMYQIKEFSFNYFCLNNYISKAKWCKAKMVIL